ncbi:MAG: hypothetical protein RIF41_28700 [Polyangiaceae bacterium]
MAGNDTPCDGVAVQQRWWASIAAATSALGCGPPAEPQAPEVVVVPEELRPRGDVATPSLRERFDEPEGSSSTHLRRGRAAAPDQPVTPGRSLGGCLRSPLCGLEGLCSPRDDDLCIAEDDDDCRGSDACLGGRCTAKDGVCVASNDEDCRESWACKGWGRCFYDGDAACMAKDAADCRASTRCQREGECALRGGECVAP